MLPRLCLFKILLWTLLWTAPAAHGGAWPRDEGSGFVSFSQEFHRREDGTRTAYTSIYGEYGVTERLTFGLDAGGNHAGSYSDAVVFARYPILSRRERDNFALRLGLGLRELPGGGAEVVVQSGVAWGRGFASPWGEGWMGLDATTTYGVESSEHWSKIDLTFGLSPGHDSHLIVQLQTYHDANGSLYKIAPSYVRRLRGNLKVEIGLIQPLNGGRGTGLKAGTWFEW